MARRMYSCSVRKLFTVILGLSLFGFLCTVGFWIDNSDTIEDTQDFAEKQFAGVNERDSDSVTLSAVVRNRSEPEINLVQNNPLIQPETDDIANPTMITKPRWETLQEQRRSQLKEACRKLSGRPPFNTNITDIRNKPVLWPFIVNDKYQLMYCFISKVGSTGWKKAFLVLQGKYKRVEDISGASAHDPSLTKLSSYQTVDEITHRLDNYTTFIFVRNPFARVISAYRDKLVENHHYTSVGRLIVERYRKNPTEEELKGTNVSFPEFIKYVTDPTIKQDGHWLPMYQLVLPCSVRFDYIGKLETAEEDAKYILQNTRIDHLVHFEQTRRNVSHNQATLDRYFADVPHEDMKKLYQIYYPDFVLFGYQLPDFMKGWVW